MRASRINSSSDRVTRSAALFLFLSLPILAGAARAATMTQIVLSRDLAPAGDVKGPVDLTINPGFDEASVTITVDGQKIIAGLHSPYRLPVDFGPLPVEHKITVTALSIGGNRVQWSSTINKGHLPLSIKLHPVDLANRIFEVAVTSPQDDPITIVELWNGGKSIDKLDAPPYRFTISPDHFAQKFVQVTARTKSGDEAADFWSASGEVQAAAMDVRTVPLFVSVVDRNGTTRDDVDKSLFHVIDNGAEGKIIEIGKAFDQPISIALLLDASSSMNVSMGDATRAALSFVQRTLKQGDRCTVFSVRDTPRRELPLTKDRDEIARVLTGIRAAGRTSLYDAIASAERELKDEKNRRAIVVLTDGGDTSSIASFDEIDRLTKEAGVPIYFIAYEEDIPEDPQDLNRLQYLASETGGFVVTASAQNLEAKYGDIEKDLRAQYAILYQISDYAKHNQWRKVNVMLKSSTLTARTIRGYFAP